jgi:porphobilinogen synthase
VAESRLSVDDLVAPLFVADGLDGARPVPSLPGVVQHTVATLSKEVTRLVALGVPGVILFGLPRPGEKDATGSAALRADGITQRALAAVREEVGDSLVVMADCCLDEFTDHGHCGVLDPRTGDVDNDATLPLYAQLAVSQAGAGADLIAPSGMMDGQVGAVRAALDEAGHPDVGVLAYAAKYASSLYGPFRDAAGVPIDAKRWPR